MDTVYIETTVVGHLAGRVQRDPIVAVNGVQYRLTWNFKHIANALLRGRIEQVCREAGFDPPIICTPEELMGTDDGS